MRLCVAAGPSSYGDNSKLKVCARSKVRVAEIIISVGRRLPSLQKARCRRHSQGE